MIVTSIDYCWCWRALLECRQSAVVVISYGGLSVNIVLRRCCTGPSRSYFDLIVIKKVSIVQYYHRTHHFSLFDFGHFVLSFEIFEIVKGRFFRWWSLWVKVISKGGFLGGNQAFFVSGPVKFRGCTRQYESGEWLLVALQGTAWKSR